MFDRVGSDKAKSVDSKRSVHGVTAPATRKIIGLSGVALAFAVLSSSGAMAQCTGFGALPAGFAAMPTFASTTASNLISTVTTMNTAFLTQTTAFISAPPNPQPDQTGAGVWVRAVGGKLTTKSDTSLNMAIGGVPVGTANCANSTATSFGGVQAGSDYARLNWNGWNLHLGTTAGYGESTNTTSTNQIKAQAPFAGVYAAATKGGFYIDGQVIGTYYEFDITDASVNVTNQHSNAHGVGFAGSIGYNIPLKDNYFIEPSAGVVWSRTQVNAIQGAPLIAGVNIPGTVSVDDVQSTLGHAGLRVGTSIVSGNLALQPFVGASVWHEFAPAATANATTNFAAVLPPPTVEFTIGQSSTRVGTYGQYSAGLAGTILNTGWVGYIRGDYRLGENIDGWSANAGLRYQFTPEPAALTGKHPIYKAAPVVAMYDWTGIYIGVNGGITNGRAPWNFVPSGIPVDPTPKFAGGIAGGQIGYNRQFGKWVLGVEADADWANAIGSSPCPNGPFFTCEVHLKWLASGTGRVGYAFWDQRILTYLKGGLAAGGVEVITSGNVPPPVTVPTAGSSATVYGWTGGIGTEVGLTKNWSAKGEYMYYSLGAHDYLTSATVSHVQPKGGITRVGLNYRF